MLKSADLFSEYFLIVYCMSFGVNDLTGKVGNIEDVEILKSFRHAELMLSLSIISER